MNQYLIYVCNNSIITYYNRYKNNFEVSEITLTSPIGARAQWSLCTCTGWSRDLPALEALVFIPKRTKSWVNLDLNGCTLGKCWVDGWPIYGFLMKNHIPGLMTGLFGWTVVSFCVRMLGEYFSKSVRIQSLWMGMMGIFIQIYSVKSWSKISKTVKTIQPFRRERYQKKNK